MQKIISLNKFAIVGDNFSESLIKFMDKRTTLK